jgi:hypothetical protein
MCSMLVIVRREGGGGRDRARGGDRRWIKQTSKLGGVLS